MNFRHSAARRCAWVLKSLLIVITLLVLAALMLPTLAPHRRDHSPMAYDRGNLRQIGQASLIYAGAHRDHLPQRDNVVDFAVDLARDGGLNDASVWISAMEWSDPRNQTLSTVTAPNGVAAHPAFAQARLAYAVIARGLHVGHSSRPSPLDSRAPIRRHLVQGQPLRR